MPKDYFVGPEAALAELLRRTDTISVQLKRINDSLEDLMTFEDLVALLLEYAKSLKAQNEALQSDDAADKEKIAALEADVAAKAKALADANQAIAEDTAQENALAGPIKELLNIPADETPAV